MHRNERKNEIKAIIGRDGESEKSYHKQKHGKENINKSTAGNPNRSPIVGNKYGSFLINGYNICGTTVGIIQWNRLNMTLPFLQGSPDST